METQTQPAVAVRQIRRYEVLRCPSPGICIYCGASDVLLTDEHIVPRALNGALILNASSCRDCAAITSKFEQTVARLMYGVYRKVHNYQTYNKAARKRFDITTMPLAYLAVVFPPPGILAGLPKTEGSPAISLYPIADIEELRRLSEDGTPRFKASFNWGDLARMLAKIAHGCIVAKMGLQGYKPLLREIILGRSPYISHYVGCRDEWLLLDTYYHLSVEAITFGDATYLVVNIQLLGGSETPMYQVVAALVEDASILTKLQPDRDA